MTPFASSHGKKSLAFNLCKGSEKGLMRQPKREGSAGKSEKGVKEKNPKYVLRLYVSGMTPRSIVAIQNIRKICDRELKGRCDLQVIDIHNQPVLAKGEQIIATPTLIKKVPPPLRKFIGDLTNTERILIGLDLKRK
jgi:circadian clock protein KaiB